MVPLNRVSVGPGVALFVPSRIAAVTGAYPDGSCG